MSESGTLPKEKEKGKDTPESKGAQYHCDYCRADITKVVRIKCAVCRDFDLCLDCFAVGVEVFPHKKDHAYRVMDHVTTPIFDAEWGADEELLLLEAIESFGLGNWGDVADHVGTKNKQRCEQHYIDVYLNSPQAPLPDMTAALPLKDATDKARKSNSQQSAMDTSDSVAGGGAKKSKGGRKKTKAAGGGKAPGGSNSTTAGMPSSLSSKPGKGGGKHDKGPGWLGHLVGYMPNRGDFSTEYDNDAELILADMEFKDEDTPWERDLKLRVLDIYNSKLDSRLERKKFILERGLLYKKDKKRSKEERDVYNNMRVFARFQSAEEHEQLCQGLINELRLRRRIEQLQNYRLNGIRTLAQGEAFDEARKKRDQLNSRKGGKEAISLFENNPLSLPNSSALSESSSASASSSSSTSGRKRTADGETRSSGASKSRKPGEDGVDMSSMESFELLSEIERTLCSELRIIPQHYMVIKERVLRECATRGFLSSQNAKQLIKIDVRKTSKLFDFFVSVGWVKSEPATLPAPSPPSSSLGSPGVSDMPSSPASPMPSPSASTLLSPSLSANHPPVVFPASYLFSEKTPSLSPSLTNRAVPPTPGLVSSAGHSYGNVGRARIPAAMVNNPHSSMYPPLPPSTSSASVPNGLP